MFSGIPGDQRHRGKYHPADRHGSSHGRLLPDTALESGVASVRFNAPFQQKGKRKWTILWVDPNAETVEQFILAQLDRAGLGHNTFTAEALALIVRSGEGLLRRTRNL